MTGLAAFVRNRRAAQQTCPLPAPRLVLAPPPPTETHEYIRAKVDALLNAMAEQNESRAEWWKRPVSGWKAGRLEWTNAETGKEVAIHVKRLKAIP